MNVERRYLPRSLHPVKIETRADGTKAITGYAAVFYDPARAGTQYQLWEDTIERIMPGAFDRALQEDDCRALFNHDPNCVMGRTKSGTCRLSIDAVGLRYEIEPADTQISRDVQTWLDRGDIDGSSFSFNTTDVSWRSETDPATKRETYIREIRGVTLFDVGPVTFPAYEATSAECHGLRSAEDAGEARKAYDAFRRGRDQAARQARARAIEVQERETTDE